jgi:hypothetical protein
LFLLHLPEVSQARNPDGFVDQDTIDIPSVQELVISHLKWTCFTFLKYP